MSRFLDTTTRRVVENGVAPRVPSRVARRAQWRCGLLLAAAEWRDVTFIGPLASWPEMPERPGVHIDGRWYVTFRWDEAFGATDICLERRKPPASE